MGEEAATHNVEPINLETGAHLLSHFQVCQDIPDHKIMIPHEAQKILMTQIGFKRRAGDVSMKEQNRPPGKPRGGTRKSQISTTTLILSGSR